MADFNITPSAIVSDISFGLGLLSSFGAKVDVVGIYSNGTSNISAATSGASNILNSLLGTSNVTPSFGQLFVNARPLKAMIRETSRVMEHPIETGSVIADFHIVNPVEIELPLLVKSEFYAATYTQIRNAWTQATALSVKTRTGVYQNMIIVDMPHEEDSEMFDAIIITLRMRQVLLFVQGGNTLQSGYQPLDAANSNTLVSGLQTGAQVVGKLLTTATSIASYAALAKRL